MNFNDQFLKEQADPLGLTALVKSQYAQLQQMSLGTVRVQALDEIAQEIGQLDFRAIDTNGETRMIMSAIDLFNSYGVHAHLAGFDANGVAQFYLSADDGSIVAGGGNLVVSKDGIVLATGVAGGNKIKWYTSTTLNGDIYVYQSLPKNHMVLESLAPSSGLITQADIILFVQSQTGGPTNQGTVTLAANNTGTTALTIDVTSVQINGSLSVNGSSVCAANTATVDVFRVDNPGGASAFVGTINGAPAGASVTYNITSGQEAAMVPASTSQLAKLRLYNTTRGNSALISNCNTATNVITLTSSAPANWANGDTITIASQTVSGGGFSWIDLEITSGPTGKSGLLSNASFVPGSAGDSLRFHPFTTFSSSKVQILTGQVAAVTCNSLVLSEVLSNVFSIAWTGTPTTVLLRQVGYID